MYLILTAINFTDKGYFGSILITFITTGGLLILLFPKLRHKTTYYRSYASIFNTKRIFNI